MLFNGGIEAREAIMRAIAAIIRTPMSSLAKNTPMITVANSGAEEPAAMKVAPATSGDSLNSEKRGEFQVVFFFSKNNNFVKKK